MATLFNQGTLYYTPQGGMQVSAVSNTTGTDVAVTYGMELYHTASPETFGVSDTILYTVALQNTGTGTLVNAVVESDLGGGALDYVEGSAAAFLYNGASISPFPVMVSTGSVIFTFPDPIPAGAIVFLVYNATVNATAADTVVSLATATAREGSPGGAILTDSASATITRVPLTIVKSAPASAGVGETISFVFTVTNNTAAPIVLDALTDQLPAQFSFTGLALTVDGVAIPLVATDYQLVDGLLTVDPAAQITLPAGAVAVYTVTGVVTA